MTVVSSGRIMLHAPPITVCLYRIFMSRQLSMYISSRYFHISLQYFFRVISKGYLVCSMSLIQRMYVYKTVEIIIIAILKERTERTFFISPVYGIADADFPVRV